MKKLVFKLSEVLTAWQTFQTKADSIHDRVHPRTARDLAAEGARTQVDPRFRRGAYGHEDVRSTGEFPHRRDERMINIQDLIPYG